MNISIEDLSMVYPTGKRALQEVNVSIQSPNLIGLLGPNGAGKSTLMKLLVAALLPTEGGIKVDGVPLLTCEKEFKTKLGYLPQSFGLYDELTVWQFLDYMAALKGIKNEKDKITQVIEETHLQEKSKTKISTLSGGQRQRVGIAQALLGNPEILIFDEPTVGLDPEERISFRTLFSKAAQDKIVLLSTHIIEDVQAICNRLIVINDGRILFDGTPAALIVQAHGHVGVFTREEIESMGEQYHVTARMNTAGGIVCRIVADELPEFAKEVEPTLEDAYLYCIKKGADNV